MNTKPKPCKGINKAYGFEGCGKDSLVRKFGLCSSCLWDWMANDERGKVWKKKQFDPKVKSNMERNNRIRKKEGKVSLMTIDRYRAVELQPVINRIARIIDQGTPCIATDSYSGKMTGGHYFSVGSNRTTSLNLHNIHIQSFHSNGWNGGDDKRYKAGLIKRYGIEYFNFIESLKQTPSIHLTKDDLIEIRRKALKIASELKKEILIVRTPKERIALRNEVNAKLNIYPAKFSMFETYITDPLTKGIKS